MGTKLITIRADFNRTKGGRLLLSDLVMHERTPFPEIAASSETILFVHGEDVVSGTLAHDARLGWVGVADWSTQTTLRSYPAAPGA